MGYKEAGSLLAILILSIFVAIFTNYLASQIRIVGGIEGFTEMDKTQVGEGDVKMIKTFLKYINIDPVDNSITINAPGGIQVDERVQINDESGIKFEMQNIGKQSIQFNKEYLTK